MQGWDGASPLGRAATSWGEKPWPARAAPEMASPAQGDRRGNGLVRDSFVVAVGVVV